MSGLGAGIKLGGLNLNQAPVISNTPVQLRGLNLGQQVNNNVPQNTTWNDNSNVNTPNYGNVPSPDDLNPMFPQENTQQDYTVQNNNPVNTTVKTKKSAEDRSMGVGIGMAVGGVGGAVIGGYFGPAGSAAGWKIGALIGVALGGVIGNAVSN